MSQPEDNLAAGLAAITAAPAPPEALAADNNVR